MDDKPIVLDISNVKKKYVIKHIEHNPYEDSGRIRNTLYKASQIFKSSKKEDFWALDGVTFKIKKGEKVGIIGKNGAGKSTLLKIISRITEPTDGRIEMLGTISSMLEVGTGFNSELTGRENIYLNGAILGMTKEEIDSKFNNIVEFSEVGQFIDTPVKRYSSGMFVRLAFAVASNLEPDILLVDEVLAVGDARFQRKCIDKMRSIADSGKTILFVSHQMNTIRQLCDRVIVLKKGKLIFDGDVDEGINIYNSESYLGKSKHYDFKDVDRPKKLTLKEGEILSLDVLHTENAVYDAKSPIDFCLHIKIKADNIGDLSFRLHISKLDETPVENIFSETIQYIDKPGLYDINASITRHNLSPGSYYATVVLTRGNSKFVTGDIDLIKQAFIFDVLNPDGTSHVWPKEWGNSYSENIEATIEKHEDN